MLPCADAQAALGHHSRPAGESRDGRPLCWPGATTCDRARAVLADRARSLRRGAGLQLRLEGRARELPAADGRDGDAHRDDVAAVADRAGGRAAALDALDSVVRPANVTSDVGLLFIGGGSNDRNPPPAPAAWLVDAARDTGTVSAELRMVPNQPVIFKDDPTRKPRSEDDFIAYTWDKFLRTGDEKWPARLPMTKSAVRAMDTVTAFAASAEGGGQQGRPVRRLRRVEARLDDVGDGRGRHARRRHRSGGDRSAEHRAVVRASLARVRRLVRRREGLRRARDHGLDRHARVPRADEDRGAVRVSRAPDDAEAA